MESSNQMVDNSVNVANITGGNTNANTSANAYTNNTIIPNADENTGNPKCSTSMRDSPCLRILLCQPHPKQPTQSTIPNAIPAYCSITRVLFGDRNVKNNKNI